MSDTETGNKDDSEYVRLADTDATTTDSDGNPRVKMEALSKGGEKEPDDPAESDEE
ncbi:hypothetical protein [Haloparvum sedimenti]|uniref:hypothetical protein n=1 Tax=Haloparvum sedimenti TaxID=1678448 RepID=UPI00159ECBAD|nr:hypothetical protein [Haloparvum sedimenti]